MSNGDRHLHLVLGLGLLSVACGPGGSASQPPATHAPAVATVSTPDDSLRPAGDLGYDLQRADLAFDLPPDLAEISALTDVDAETVACLQDEKGILYFIDVASGEVTERLPFGAAGDYEGLTRVGASFFVLRSDGLVTELRRAGDRMETVSTFEPDLAYGDFEGLCHDERRGLLLVAPKDASSDEDVGEDDRPLHAVDLQTRVTLPEPVLMLSRRAAGLAAAALLGESAARGGRGAKKRGSLKLRFSSVAVHPFTDHVYLLSAVDRALLVVDRQGGLLALHVFPAGELPKPEGITFLANGDMLICSEGKDEPAALRVYGYRHPSG